MKRPLIAIMLFLAACAAPAAAPAPTPEKTTVLLPVQELFDAMRAGDSARVRRVFHPDATLATVGSDEGGTVLKRGSLESFVEAVGSPHEAIWDERIGDPVVHVDGDLAMAWMDYAFYLGEEFSHCGVNAMQLLRDGQGWRIIHIIDTRRKQKCGKVGRG